MKRDFRFYYYIFLTLLSILFLTEYIMYSAYEIPVVALQLTAVVLGATFTAYLTTTTYDYISRTTQEREWKRGIQMKIWNDVYLKIYREVVSYLWTAQSFEYVHSDIWRDFNLSETETILEIINPSYLKELRSHQDLLNRYQKAFIAFNQITRDVPQSYHQQLFPQEPPGQLRPLSDTLGGNRLYFAGGVQDIPPSDREFYTRTYNQLQDKYPDVDVDATSAIQIVKSKVQGFPETEAFLKLQDEFLKSTQRVIRLTKTIVQTPYMS